MDRRCSWLNADGDASDVVISSTLRLSRNIDGFAFTGTAGDSDLARLKEMTHQALTRYFDAASTTYLDVADLSFCDLFFLGERRLVDGSVLERRARESGQRSKSGSSAVLFQDDETFTLTINAEDHLRIAGRRRGLALEEIWRTLNDVDDKLGERLSFTFDERLGYLTANPALVGSGLVARVMLHLPALIKTGEIQKAIRSLAKLNLRVETLPVDDNDQGCSFLIAEGVATLGTTEEDFIDRFSSIIRGLVEYERQAQKVVLARDLAGVVKSSREKRDAILESETISGQEAVSLLSALRFGFRVGIFEDDPRSPSLGQFDEAAFMRVQVAHLLNLPGEDMSEDEVEQAVQDADEARADYLRRFLQ